MPIEFFPSLPSAIALYLQNFDLLIINYGNKHGFFKQATYYISSTSYSITQYLRIELFDLQFDLQLFLQATTVIS